MHLGVIYVYYPHFLHRYYKDYIPDFQVPGTYFHVSSNSDVIIPEFDFCVIPKSMAASD